MDGGCSDNTRYERAAPMCCVLGRPLHELAARPRRSMQQSKTCC